MRQVYLDYSATTPVKEEVLKEMIPYFSESFGNTSSLYTKGTISKEAITKARSKVSSLIGADENEIFFTASGTEADDWAIICLLYTSDAADEEDSVDLGGRR